MANAVFPEQASADYFSLPEDVTSDLIDFSLPEGVASGVDVGAAGGDGVGGCKRTADRAGLRVKKRKADQAGLETTPPPASLMERRARNRDHARRTRLRKKFLLESLQEQIERLKGEKMVLQAMIKQELPARAASLLKDAGYIVEGDEGSLAGGLVGREPQHAPPHPMLSITCSDPSLPDNPIVYVSQGFLDLTGYTLNQVLGRNCRFLQGPGTDQALVDVVRHGFKEGTDVSACLLNYRADGTPFWNQFVVTALKDEYGNVVNWLGVHSKVSKVMVEM